MMWTALTMPSLDIQICALLLAHTSSLDPTYSNSIQNEIGLNSLWPRNSRNQTIQDMSFSTFLFRHNMESRKVFQSHHSLLGICMHSENMRPRTSNYEFHRTYCTCIEISTIHLKFAFFFLPFSCV